MFKIIPSFILVSILSIIACGPPQERNQTIQIKGSDTEVNLVQSMAETYMDAHPEASLAVTGGGSGTGIAALINGKTDIANSSRPMKEEEITAAEKNGVEPFATIFAIDGLALIIHPSQIIEGLTIAEIASIFNGEVDNWSDLGGEALSISAYGRQSNSGTFTYFRDNIIKDDYSTSIKQMNGNSQIVEAVKNDPSGIGYVGVGYIQNKEGGVVDGIKVLNVAISEGDSAVSPMEKANVISGAYPISRPLFQYTNGKPTGKVLDFIRYELGEEGQRTVSENGYYALTEEYIQQNKAKGVMP